MPNVVQQGTTVVVVPTNVVASINLNRPVVSPTGSTTSTETVVNPKVDIANVQGVTNVGGQGMQGPPGPTGAAGSGGDKTFDYAQPTSSASWTIAHGLGKYPSVSVVDSAGSQIFGSVKYLDLNTVRIDFSLPFSGSAFLN